MGKVSLSALPIPATMVRTLAAMAGGMPPCAIAYTPGSGSSRRCCARRARALASSRAAERRGGPISRRIRTGRVAGSVLLRSRSIDLTAPPRNR